MAWEERAHEAKFLFEIAGVGSELRVARFDVRESLSTCYVVDLDLASLDEIQLESAIGKAALLTVVGDQEDRYFHGIVNLFMHSGSRGRFLLYQARVVPPLWLLSLEQDCRIFQNKNVPDIVKQILQEGGITGDRFQFRLQGQYESREYCVQYRETDFHFISRLLEEEGIFYFFEHSRQKNTLIFGDGTIAYQPIQGESKVVFNYPNEMVPGEEYVYEFGFARQIRSGKITLNDFNFERPTLDLTSQDQDRDFQKLEVYDYPGIYTEQGKGQRLAKVRLQESVSFKDKAEGESVCPRLMPGFTFTLNDHERESLNREYLITEVLHKGSQPQALEEVAPPDQIEKYWNRFTGIPSSTSFRPDRLTPKPVVKGIQTAMVVGPKGEEIYTDKYGRVKVQFHWDREGQYDEKSSCWIRVSQNWAGKNWGAIILPRIGQEVLVAFLEGDPDRPMITGCVYNAECMPPYELPTYQTQSTLKSDSSKGGGGFNEIRFEDKKGEEQIFIHAEKNQDIRIKNDRYEWIGQDSHLMVKRDQLELVEGNRHLSVKGDQNQKVDGTISLQAGLNKLEKMGSKYAVDAGMEIHLKAGMNVVIEAGMTVTLKAGGGFITVGPTGVSISGIPVLINSGGSAGSGSGSSPESPVQPKEADKGEAGEKPRLPEPKSFQREVGTAAPCVQAKALKKAAQSGAPFCEVCQAMGG
jgi:type VI secretion system secreted protein VgrG